MAFAHSIMFHHFHNRKHPKRQGSLSGEDFREMIEYLARRSNIVGASEFRRRLLGDQLGHDDICLSFDDALKCQVDVAVPILKEFGLTAFFFVYSAPFVGGADNLEIFSLFRATAFDSAEDFYAEFFTALGCATSLRRAEIACDEEAYLSDFPFYTRNDRIFRYIRDNVMPSSDYNDLNFELMRRRGFDPAAARDGLWMNAKDLRTLTCEGHLIGLHSHTHPTKISKLSLRAQFNEYRDNLLFLNDVLVGFKADCMSHPCGDYNKDTLTALRKLGVRVGFRSNMRNGPARSALEVPRKDHATVYKAMNS